MFSTLFVFSVPAASVSSLNLRSLGSATTANAYAYKEPTTIMADAKVDAYEETTTVMADAKVDAYEETTKVMADAGTNDYEETTTVMADAHQGVDAYATTVVYAGANKYENPTTVVYAGEVPDADYGGDEDTGAETDPSAPACHYKVDATPKVTLVTAKEAETDAYAYVQEPEEEYVEDANENEEENAYN